MAQYTYQGQILVKKTDREYAFACIENRDGKIIKIMISGTEYGAGAETRRRIGYCEQNIKNFKASIKALEQGRTKIMWKERGYSFPKNLIEYKTASYIAEERRALEPIEYYKMRIQEELEAIEWYQKNWIVVPVEKKA